MDDTWLEMHSKPHQDAAGRIYDDQAIIVLPLQGNALILNGVGSRIWELSDGRRTSRDILESLCAECDVSSEEASRDIQEFLRLLESKGVITLEEKPL
jgi:hypothetical protein